MVVVSDLLLEEAGVFLTWPRNQPPTMSKCPARDFEPSPEKEVKIAASQLVRTQPRFIQASQVTRGLELSALRLGSPPLASSE